MKAIDELFFLCHLDLGVGEDEIESLFEESTFEQRCKWMRHHGFEVKEDD